MQLIRRTGLRRFTPLQRHPRRTQTIEPFPGALEAWFQFHLSIPDYKMICENCGDPLQAFWSNETIARSHQAHILPFVDFPSVGTHLDNHLLLGGIATPCSCHAKYDRSWMTAVNMDVIEIAKVKFLKFAHQITPAERLKLPAIFLPLIDWK